MPTLPVALALGVLAAVSSPAAEHYERLAEIPISGEGGWDYLSVQPDLHRLYVAHATKVVIIDTRTDTVLGDIADTPGVHGIAVAPGLGLGFTSNGRENKVGIVNLATLETRSKVETGQNPDAILYDPEHLEVYAFNGRGNSVTVFDAKTGGPITTIPLGGKPEFGQLDPVAGRIYNNIEDTNEVVAIDDKTHAVVQRWRIGEGEEPSGLAIDLDHHRLFVGCSNAKLMVLDSTDGHVVATIPAGKGIDAAAFDPVTQLAFTSNGADGTVTIAHEDTPDTFTVIQTLTTQRSARTMTVDPETHKLYLAAATFSPAETGGRPKMIPGTMKVLVYGLTK
ncbi:MAG: YncE family protein [Opitutus sp.]